MGCPTVKKAFEDSLNKSTLVTSDKVLVYTAGTIYNVTYGDFATQLGVTGSLTDLSTLSSGAVPLLAGTAPDYNIRGIVGGNGVSAIQNAQGNITINMTAGNAGAAADGLGLIVNPAASTVNWKRIRAGSGIDLTSSANSVTINNTLIGDSKAIAVTSLSATATTTIGTVDTPVVVSGTFSDVVSQQYSVSAGGRITYNQSFTDVVGVSSTILFTAASGTKTITFYIARNGSIITASGVSIAVASTAVESISLNWAVSLDAGDYIEIYVENNTDDVDVSVQKCILRAQ